MLIQCTLYPHLADVEQKSQHMFDELVYAMAKQEGVTEQLKADDMTVWVKQMDNIRNRVKEIIRREIVYQ